MNTNQKEYYNIENIHLMKKNSKRSNFLYRAFLSLYGLGNIIYFEKYLDKHSLILNQRDIKKLYKISLTSDIKWIEILHKHFPETRHFRKIIFYLNDINFNFLYKNCSIEAINLVTLINILFDENKIEQVKTVIQSDNFKRLTKENLCNIYKNYLSKIQILKKIKNF